MNDPDQSFSAIQRVMPLFHRNIIKSVMSFLFVERVAQTCKEYQKRLKHILFF